MPDRDKVVEGRYVGPLSPSDRPQSQFSSAAVNTMKGVKTNKPAPGTTRSQIHRRSKDEKEKLGPREDFQGVHRVRSLKSMLKSELNALADDLAHGRQDEALDRLAKAFLHWNLDVQHEFRMVRDLESQKIMSRIITLLELDA